jgi:CheY-like chemotaxis protein
MDETKDLKGRRVLVVEDETLIAMFMETLLADLGCEVLGPVHALGPALDLVSGENDIDLAFLDVNLGGQPSFPVADALRRRGVPVVFCTGYGDAGLREVDRGAPVLRKPYRAGDLAAALSAALPVEGEPGRATSA